MAKTTILRFEKVKHIANVRQAGAHQHRHHLETPNADPALKSKNVTLVGDSNLGKTVQDPYKYKGSGLRWENHLKAHSVASNDIKTWILHETTSLEDVERLGLYYSSLFNVVDLAKDNIMAKNPTFDYSLLTIE